MSIMPQQCGVRFDPPALVLTYHNHRGNLHRRTMPIRGFTKRSGITRTAESLVSNPRHRKYLENISRPQIEKLLRIIQEHMKGISLDETLGAIKMENTIDPDEDLNKLDDIALSRKKAIMDEDFEKNRKKPGDEGFEYEVEVDFLPAIETSGWDDQSDPEF
ncbi:centrosomal protein of 19 kDa-like [Saccoglossus kowalevskii]|uniref:Centrosomal protein of 19 kDa n=1 Tax=Saccoglossus kowalevskii TaxID=10224 RepID=A0ABM0MVA4_SACKO|nr:PREDICTED: centrosomal protein of 19 kDa-like isoform X1 [Saccoglossus kowalevskii]XP_006823945.1 PREDICTED: centrosomal protein of 19 kDa-like isoform X2 [Saccoglossus kowalevskii]